MNTASLACTYTTDMITLQNYITFTTPTAYTGISQYSWSFGYIKNPASAFQYDEITPISVTVSGGNPWGTASDLSVSYTPGSIYQATLAQANAGTATAGGSDTYTFKFKLANNVPRNGQLQITFPSAFTSAPSNLASITQVSIYGSSVGTVSVSYISAAPLVALLDNLFSSSGVTASSSQYVIVTMTAITNPKTIGTTGSFSLTTLDDNGIMIDTLSSGLTISVTKAGSISVTQFTPTYSTVDTQESLIIKVTPSVGYQAGGYIEIVGPSTYVKTTTPPTCTFVSGFVSGGSSSCTATNAYTIHMTKDLTAKFTIIYVILKTFQNPLGVIALPSFAIYFKNLDGTIVAQETTGFTYTTIAGTCSVTSATRSSSLVVGTSATYLINFSCTHRITSIGKINLIFPVDQAVYSTGSSCVDGITSAVIPCTATQNSGLLQITATQWCSSTSSDCPASTSLSLKLLNVKNPGYIVPTLTSSVIVRTQNQINAQWLTVDELTTGVIVPQNLVPGTISNLAVARSGSLLTGAITTFTFTFTLATAIPSGGIITITFPDKTAYQNQPTPGISCTSSVGSGTCSSVGSTSDSTVVLSVTWSAACTSGCNSGQAFTLSVTNVYNPFSTTANANSGYTISTQTSAAYQIDTGTATSAMPTLTTNVLTVLPLSSPTTPIIVGATATYTIVVQNPNNKIPSLANGGSLVIVLPSDVLLTGTTCTASSSSITLTCTGNTGTQKILVTSPSDIAKGSTITITMPNNVRNPQTGKPSVAFQIYTYYNAAGIDTSTSLKVTCDASNAILSVVSKRDSTTIETEAKFTISFQTTNPIPAGSVIAFKIPNDQAMLTITGSSTILATYIQSGSTKSVTRPVFYSSPYTSFDVPEWCAADNGGTICPSTFSSLINFIGFSNPSTAVAPTLSIQISINTGPPNNYMIDAVTVGVITNPYVNYGPLQSVLITRSSDIVGAPTTLTIIFVTNTNSNALLTGTSVTVYLALPVSFLYQKTGQPTTCTSAITGIASTVQSCSPVIAASDPQNMGSYAQSISFALPCSTSSPCSPNKSFTVTLGGLLNPYSTKANTGTLTTATQSQATSGGLISVINSLDISVASVLNAYSPNVITVNSITRSSATVGATVTISFDIKLTNRLQKSGYINIDIPTSQFVPNGASFTCLYYNGASYITSSTFIQTATSTTFNSFQIKEWCNGGGDYCIDGTQLKFIISTGFNNLGYVAVPTTFITITTYTADQLGKTDQISGVIATPALTAAVLNVNSLTLGSTQVAAVSIPLDISVKFGAPIVSGNKIMVTFGAEFVRTDQNIMTCADYTSGTASSLACSQSSSSGVLNTVTITNMCSTTCTSLGTYVIRLVNINNILYQRAFTGTLTVQALTSAGQQIASGTFALSGITTLIPGILLSPVINRLVTQQGKTSTFTLSWITPGILLSTSQVELDLPLNQIIIQSGTSAFVAKDAAGSTLTYSTVAGSPTTTYNKILFNQWKCSTTCLPPITFQLTLTNSANPYVQTTSYNDFVIKFTKTTSGESIFASPTPLLAAPDLTFGLISDIVILMSNSVYVSTTPTYTISFTTTSDTPVGGKFKITFPAGRALQYSSTSIKCTSGSTTYSCSTTWSTYLTIYVNSYCTSVCPAGSFSFTFSGNMINPSTVPNLSTNFIIDSTDSSNNIINEGKILNTLVTPILPGSLASATVVRGSTSLSANSDYTITFKTTNAVPANGYFRVVAALDQITMPTGTPSCLMGFVLTSISCQIVFKNTQFEYLDMPQTCGSSGCTAGSTVVLVISGAANPSTFAANSVTSSWSIFTLTNAKEQIDGIYQNLQATPPLVGRSVLVLLAEMDSYIVNTNTNFKIAITTGASFTTAGLFDVYFPDGFATAASSSNTCILLLGVNFNMQCIYTNYPSGYLKKVELLNPCPYSCDSTSSYFYQIPITTRGDVYPVPGSFTVICRYQYVDVGMGSLNNAITLTPATLKQYYLTNQGCDTIDQYCALYLSFRLINQVPIQTGRGRITIQIPSQIKPLSNNCQMMLDSSIAGISCSQSGSTIIGTHNSGWSVTGLNITIRIAQVQNPGSTAPTDSFQITSSWDVLNNNKYYAIDQITTGIPYQVTTMTPLISLSITRLAGSLNAGYMTGSPTVLQYNFVLRHSLVATSTFQVTLPTAAQVMFSPYASSFTCYQTDYQGTNLNLLLCEKQTSTIVMVRNYCQVGDCGSGDTVYFRMYDDFIQNYYYVITPTEITTQGITVRTTTASGLYNIDESIVIPTPDLQPTPLIMPSPEVIRSNNIIGQKTYWVINFQINKNPVPSGGYVYITIPQGVLLPVQSGSMEIFNYDNNKPIYNFTYSSYPDGNSISSIQIKNFCNATQICGIGSAFSLKLDWIKNPMVQLNVKTSIIVQTRTTEGYIVEQGTTAIVNSLFAQLIPIAFEHVFIRPKDPSVGVTTTYEISFSSDADFAQVDILSLLFPSEISVLTTTTSRMLAASSTRCRSLLDPTISITCEVISKNLVYVYGLFKDNTKTYAISVENILNPPSALTTSAMVITAINSNKLLIAGIYTNTNIVIQNTLDQSTCNKVCKTCAGTTSTCTSCGVPSKYPLFKQYACTDECGTGYFMSKQTPANTANNLPQCFQCHQACDTCYGAGYDKCFACASGYLMENGKCVQWCSKGISYNSTLRQCQSTSSSCSNNCETCSTNTSYCLSCNQQGSTPMYDATQGKCLALDQSLCNNTSSAGFFVDKTTSSTNNPQCKKCSTLCNTCENSADKCTSCWGADFFTNRLINELYQTCVEQCGLGTWYNAPITTCSYCNPVNLLCSGYDANQALACNKTPEGQQLYLIDHTCALECPQKYTTNYQANTCEKGQANILSFSFIFMFACIIIGGLILLTSFLIAKRKDKSLDILYAVTAMLEFLNRICILGNLWTNSSVFSLAICFMNLIVTCAFGVFFNFLFMTPIYAYSPHFRQVFKKNCCTFQTVTALSYFAGVNVMRLLCSGLYGLSQLKADLINYRFFLVPLNTMANFTIVFTLCQFGVCLFVLMAYTVSDDIFILAVFGLVMNMIMIILQFLKHLNTRAFLAKIEN